MISPACCLTMAQYNEWMNRRMYALCATLTDEERKRDLHAFFRSIHATLDHILAADLMFLSHFRSGTERRFPEGNLHQDFQAMRAHRERTDAELLAWSGTVSADWLLEPSRFINDEDGLPRMATRGFWVMHMFNHQTHHRGQITTLLTQLGRDIGYTDLYMSVPAPA